jgi:hypothetical protein
VKVVVNRSVRPPPETPSPSPPTCLTN